MAALSAGAEAVKSAAERIWGAYVGGTPCPPVRDLLGPDDIEAACAVQARAALWVTEGRSVVGRKTGLTARGVQAQLGVDQPDRGVLFADIAVGDGGEIPPGAVLQPRVEPEIAPILDRDRTHEQPTAADVIGATAHAVPSREIVALRIAGPDIRITDTGADDGSSGLFVLDGPVRRLDGFDPVGCGMQLRKTGEKVSAGRGAACLGNALNAAVGLAGRIAPLGDPLRAGDPILTGTLAPAASVTAPGTFEATIGGLGAVRVTFL
jgi:2-keto-4-pentenoate hydratase